MRALLLALPLLFIAPSLASADSPAERASKTARALEDKGDFSTALALYSEIPMRQWTPVIRLHIAVCKGKTGQLLAAQEELAHLATETDDPALHEAAESSRKDFLSQTPTLVIHLTAASTDVVLTIDERETKTGNIPVDPGKHFVEGQRKGARVFYRELDVPIGKRIEIEVDAPAPYVPPVVRVENKIVLPPQHPDGPVSAIPGYWPWLLWGSGALLGGGFGVARWQTDQAISARASYCATVHALTCPDDGHKQDALTWNTASYILLGSALTAGTTGFLLWMLPGEKPSKIRVAWNGGGLSLAGSF